MKPTTLHKTFEKGIDGKRSLIAYVSDGIEVERWPAKTLYERLIKGRGAGDAIRFTSINATDILLLALAEKGVAVRYAAWAATGIPKGLPPEEIALAYARAPEAIFRTFTPRHDLVELKNVLALRNALMRCYGDCLRAIKQQGRNWGAPTDEGMREIPDIAAALDGLSGIRKSVVSEEGTMLDTRISKIARKIPECRTFNEIAHIGGSWISAASIVAYSGGVDRFPTVAALWHYFGQHVVDGGAPKRRKGSVVTWSPAGRTAVFMLGDSIIKNRANPWRDYFDAERAKELAVHLTKHPGCEHAEGHSTARARRKMCKEILKRFFLAVKKIPVDAARQQQGETHRAHAAASGG